MRNRLRSGVQAASAAVLGSLAVTSKKKNRDVDRNLF